MWHWRLEVMMLKIQLRITGIIFILKYSQIESSYLKSAWNGSCDRLFFSTVMYIRVKRHLKWEGGTWFRPSEIDWLVGSWGVTNKMEADLKCQFTDSGGGFLATGFTADTQTWINVLFIRDDDHDQQHTTCLNSTRARERETDCLNDWARPPSG